MLNSPRLRIRFDNESPSHSLRQGDCNGGSILPDHALTEIVLEFNSDVCDCCPAF